MLHDEVLICNAYDVTVACKTPPRRPDTLIQRLRCMFGFHCSGFTHCLCCEKRDAVVYECLMLQWNAMTTMERDSVIDALIIRAKTIGRDPHTFIWKQIRIL